MTQFELILILASAVCGLLVALIFFRSRQPYAWTLTISPVLTAGLCIAFFGLGMMADSLFVQGDSISIAIRKGIAAALLYGFFAALLCALTATMAGAAFQWVIQRVRKLCTFDAKPPSPESH
jgi:hypothetical protein